MRETACLLAVTQKSYEKRKELSCFIYRAERICKCEVSYMETNYKFAVFNRKNEQLSPEFDSEEQAVVFLESCGDPDADVGFAHSTPYRRDRIG
jgi:hypothetical protein